MKKKLYYHVYLTDDYGSWVYPFMEQYKLMEDKGLLKEFSSDDVKISCISQNDERTHVFLKLVESLGLKSTIHLYANTHENDTNMLSGINSNTTITENVTMRDIYNDSLNEDFQILYIHTKGITSVDNHLKRGNVDVFRNYYYWRQFLNWGVIERWPEACRLLERYDIVGVNYFNQPASHFSGNFWWANSSYIRTLPDPSTIEWWNELQSRTLDSWLKTAPARFRDEMWPCSNAGAKIASFKNLDNVTNLSAELIPRKHYT